MKNLRGFIDNEQQLHKVFSRFGCVTSCMIARDEHGHSKGYGFVCFSSHGEALRAIDKMSGFAPPPLYVGFAQQKEERRAQLDARYRQNQQFQVGKISIIFYVQVRGCVLRLMWSSIDIINFMSVL